MFSGDPALFNQYTYLAVDPKRHPNVKHAESQVLENWLVSDKAQALIGAYRIDSETLFAPNAIE